MNNALEIILARHSIRKFKQCEISPDLVQLILTAAMSAPSACNQNARHYIVVSDPKNLQALSVIHSGMAFMGEGSAGDHCMRRTVRRHFGTILDGRLCCGYAKPAFGSTCAKPRRHVDRRQPRRSRHHCLDPEYPETSGVRGSLFCGSAGRACRNAGSLRPILAGPRALSSVVNGFTLR